MFIFESQLHTLLAVMAGVSIGLPLRALTIHYTTRALTRLFPAKPNPAERVDMPAPPREIRTTTNRHRKADTMSRKSPIAREIAAERREAERFGRKALNRHARAVKTFERNAAAQSYRMGVFA